MTWLPADTLADVSSRAVALEVLLRGPLSRAELARRVGLSSGSLSRLTRPMLASGFLVEASPEPAAGRGRPSQPLDVAPSAHRVVGVKITEDAVYAVLTTLRAEEVARSSAPLPSHDVEAVVSAVVDTVHRLADGSALNGVGVALGGRILDRRVLAVSPYLGWKQVPLADLLKARLGVPVILENDVVALTRAEQWYGAGRTVDTFAVVTIGASVGHGLVASGAVVLSTDMGRSMVGHITVDPVGPMCPQGHRGCAEAMLTVSAITSQASMGLRRPVSYAEVLQLAAADDPVAGEVVRSSGRALGVFLSTVASVTFSDTLVLAGEGVGLLDTARREVEQGMARMRPDGAAPVELLSRDPGFSAWARGAAAVAAQEYVLG
ncbi:ROK family protein [Streptomyces sp. NPDC091280]|uniref:ROK family protein n=1 Tax=Streptomyces sp. NPDC091280 TaxID=3365984 RepID=UPI00380C44AA